MGSLPDLLKGIGNALWPQNPAPGQMSPLQRVGYATAGPEGLQHAEQDVDAQLQQDIAWAHAHPESAAMAGALGMAGADITSAVPGGIEGPAHLGDEVEGYHGAGSIYKHFPVLDKSNNSVGYLDVHFPHIDNYGKKLIHVDFFRSQGGHNLLPVFRQLQHIYPDAEGVHAQRISGLGNTRGAEHTFYFPASELRMTHRAPTAPGAQQPTGPSFTGAGPISQAAQVGQSKQELGQTLMGGQPPTPPARSTFSGPMTPEQTAAATQQLGRGLEGVHPPTDPRSAPQSSTPPLPGLQRPDLPYLSEYLADREMYRPGTRGRETYPSWLARRHPQEAAQRAARRGQGADPYNPADPLPGNERYQREEDARVRQTEQEYQSQSRAELHRALPGAPHVDEYAAQPPSTRGTFADWLRRNYADEAERRYGPSISPNNDNAIESIRGEGGPRVDEYLATPHDQRRSGYDVWLRQNYPQEAEQYWARRGGSDPQWARRAADQPRPPEGEVGHSVPAGAPHGYEYGTSLSASDMTYRDWLQQNYPHDYGEFYGSRTGVGGARPTLPGEAQTGRDRAVAEEEQYRRRQHEREDIREQGRSTGPGRGPLPHYNEFLAQPSTTQGRYSEWLRRNYPEEAEQRYGPATQGPTFQGPPRQVPPEYQPPPYRPLSSSEQQMYQRYQDYLRSTPTARNETFQQWSRRQTQPLPVQEQGHDYSGVRTTEPVYQPGDTFTQWVERNYPNLSDPARRNVGMEDSPLRQIYRQQRQAVSDATQRRFRSPQTAGPFTGETTRTPVSAAAAGPDPDDIPGGDIGATTRTSDPERTAQAVQQIFRQPPQAPMRDIPADLTEGGRDPVINAAGFTPAREETPYDQPADYREGEQFHDWYARNYPQEYRGWMSTSDQTYRANRYNQRRPEFNQMRTAEQQRRNYPPGAPPPGSASYMPGGEARGTQPTHEETVREMGFDPSNPPQRITPAQRTEAPAQTTGPFTGQTTPPPEYREGDTYGRWLQRHYPDDYRRWSSHASGTNARYQIGQLHHAEYTRLRIRALRARQRAASTTPAAPTGGPTGGPFTGQTTPQQPQQ